MKRFYLIEGLPGTGKSTITKWLAGALAEDGKRAEAILEGDENNLCDFYEIVGIPQGEYQALCRDYPEITARKVLTTEHYVYLRIDQYSEKAAAALRRFDMGDENNWQISVPDYIDCALAYVDEWVKKHLERDKAFLSDSGFLQNPINELLFRDASDEQVKQYVSQIAHKLSPLNPVCIYLKRSDAGTALEFARQAKGPGWSQRVDALLNEAGHENHFERRFALEIELLEMNLMPYAFCKVEGNDWSGAKDQMLYLITK